MIFLFTTLLAILWWYLYCLHEVASNKFEMICRCHKYHECINILGSATYDFKLDDEFDIHVINKMFKRQKIWDMNTNKNIALFGVRDITAKYIYVVYDRSNYRIIEIGWLDA